MEQGCNYKTDVSVKRNRTNIKSTTSILHWGRGHRAGFVPQTTDLLCHAQIQKVKALCQSLFHSVYFMMACFQSGLNWSGILQWPLSSVCRGQRGCTVFIYRRSRPAVQRVEGSEPVPIPLCQQQTTAWPPTQAVMFLLCLPKRTDLTMSHFFCTHTHTYTLWARPTSWQLLPFRRMAKRAGVLKQRLQSGCMSSWKMEQCLPFSLHSTFLGRRSIFIFHS